MVFTLKVTVTLTFHPKNTRVLQLYKGNHPGTTSNSTPVIERKQSVTDGQDKNNLSPPDRGHWSYEQLELSDREMMTQFQSIFINERLG